MSRTIIVAFHFFPVIVMDFYYSFLSLCFALFVLFLYLKTNNLVIVCDIFMKAYRNITNVNTMSGV